MKKRVTIKDVAERAGVTIGTVSHVINGTASISAETTARVETAVRELGYVPNVAARSMRARINHTVGLLIPKLSNVFYSEIAGVFMEEAAKEGYTLMMLSYEYNAQRERQELRSLLQNNINTAVLVNGFNDEEILKEAKERGMRLILADRRTEIPGIPYVEFDNRGMEQVIRYLYEKGYRSIGYISEPVNMTNLNDRLLAFQAGIAAYGLPCREGSIYISDTFRRGHTEFGYKYMSSLLSAKRREELPEVFVCSSDMIALGVLKAITDKGYRVPEDFGIVGYDDLDISSYTQPSLTTMRQDRNKIGKVLWDMAKSAIEGGGLENVMLEQQLVIRKTT